MSISLKYDYQPKLKIGTIETDCTEVKKRGFFSLSPLKMIWFQF